VFKQHDERTYELALRLLASGLSQTAVSRRTGVDRGTIRRWEQRGEPPRSVVRGRLAADWTVTDARAYYYLLGVYLGDGHVTHRPPNSWTLRIAADQKYPGIVREITESMSVTFADAQPRQRPAWVGASYVLSVSHLWVGAAFPQHGPGRKHLRPIELADWQLELTHRNPEALIRGLIHSDGCRTENRFKTKLPSGRVAEYCYVRYFFTNHSEDIREIFIQHCELLGVRVTQSNHRNLSISHRKSVAILEQIVGPKS
jgi:transcriptional regulator with XRE-family HTH domain